MRSAAFRSSVFVEAGDILDVMFLGHDPRQSLLELGDVGAGALQHDYERRLLGAIRVRLMQELLRHRRGGDKPQRKGDSNDGAAEPGGHGGIMIHEDPRS